MVEAEQTVTGVNANVSLNECEMAGDRVLHLCLREGLCWVSYEEQNRPFSPFDARFYEKNW